VLLRTVLASGRKRRAVTIAVWTAALSISTQAMAQCVNSGAGFFDSGGDDPLARNIILPQIPFASVLQTMNTSFTTPTNSSAYVSGPGNAKPSQATGGVWSRTVAGYTDFQADTATTLKPAVDPFNHPGAQFKQNCDRNDYHDYAGIQLGFDLGSMNIAGTGANLHFGVTGGYLSAWGRYGAPGGATYKDPEKLKTDFEIPFVGLYGVLTNKGFFADTLVRWDFYQSTTSRKALSDTFNDFTLDLPSVKNKARGLSVLANAGYQIPLGSSGWFIEPSVGVAWSRVQVDPVTMVDSSGLGVAVRSDDIESLLGRATLRIGATLPGSSFTWQPFLTASVFREFAGQTTMSGKVLDPNDDTELHFGNSDADNTTITNGTTFTSTTQRIGTYGQLGLGTSVIIGDTGWLGFVRSDAKVGEEFRGVSVATGMRYQW